MIDVGFRIFDYVFCGFVDLFIYKFGLYWWGNIVFLVVEVGVKYLKKLGLSLVVKLGDGFEVLFWYFVKNFL